MEWLLAAPQIRNTFYSLGSLEGDSYVVNPNALEILEEINYKLCNEDQTLRTFRRAIGFGQNVRTDLIPILEHAKDNEVRDLAIKILVNLTLPLECLFSVDVMYRSEIGRNTIFEINRTLSMCKEAFSDSKSTKAIVEYMKQILDLGTKMTSQCCDKVNNCLLLLSNILHIPEFRSNFLVPAGYVNTSQPSVSMQNTIVWNLFIQSIDKVLIYMITCSQRTYWNVAIVQLISLLYKNQHVNTLSKLLNIWFDASLSESSGDDESNTTPGKQGHGSGDSSPMLTSDPTSDSSDTGGGSKNDFPEERRQALRVETDATLQEVCRKGQEYQNSILLATEIQNSTSQKQNVQENLIESKSKPVELYTSSDKMETVDDQQRSSNILPKFLPPNSLPPTITKKLYSTLDAVQFSVSGTDKFSPPLQTSTCQKVPNFGTLQLTKGWNGTQKRECPSSQSENSDCGYGTQVENQESVSTSSNDDDVVNKMPQHQKPPCNTKPRSVPRSVTTPIDQKELRHKKLVKRSKSSLINMKGLIQHTPTDEVISNLLKEFTVDFLLKGYDQLAHDMHAQLLDNSKKIPIDSSHFFWLITYFLKFAAQLELDLEHVRSILTYDLISYLTYEGVMLCEQLELNSRQEGADLKTCLKPLHLVVAAIKEILQTIETYKKISHLSDEDRACLDRLEIQITGSEDIRCLFVLLLRKFSTSLHTKQYLLDLIVTNHMLLMMTHKRISSCTPNIDMVEHISQFATFEIMHFYGLLLDDFNSNGKFVNACILTMMHHVGGDLEQIEVLLQPIMLKVFSRIWETDYDLCDDWSDLIEYVIQRFVRTPQKYRPTAQITTLTAMTKEHNMENTTDLWTKEEVETLYWYYVQSKKTVDLVGKIVKLFSSNGNKNKTRLSIIQQLLQQDIITLLEYDDLMKFEDAEYERTLLTTPTSSVAESGIELKESERNIKSPKRSDDIQILRELIVKENREKHLIWLQKFLLECCYVKLYLKENAKFESKENLEHVMEPVAYHAILKNQSIPIVQWNSEQAQTMLYQPFVLLLHKLGFHLPADAGSVFARIPDSWSAETMFNLAQKLGPIDNLLIKFDVNRLDKETINEFEMRRKSSRSDSGVHFDLDIENLSASNDIDYFLGNSPEISQRIDENLCDRLPNETFLMPKAKQVKCKPELDSSSNVPNWLQLVMRSKGTVTNDYRIDSDVTMSSSDVMSNRITTAATTTAPTSHLIATAVTVAPVTSPFISEKSNGLASASKQATTVAEAAAEQLLLQQQNAFLTEDDSLIKPVNENDRNETSSNDFYTRSGSGDLENEYSAMVAAVYKNEFANFDTLSISSNLTQMYVSDDDE